MFLHLTNNFALISPRLYLERPCKAFLASLNVEEPISLLLAVTQPGSECCKLKYHRRRSDCEPGCC